MNPDELPSDLAYLFRRLHQAARSAISSAQNATQLKDPTRASHAEIDRLFVQQMITTRSTIACKDGCSLCCYLKVDATAAEVFLLADYLRKHCSEEERTQILERAEANRRKIIPMSRNQHMTANLPCCLLVNGRCSAYNARPASCRMFHAQRFQTCQDSYDQPSRMDLPDSQVPEIRVVTAVAHNALQEAYKESGYDSRSYDVNSALVEAISNGKNERRWVEGKRAFSSSAAAK